MWMWLFLSVRYSLLLLLPLLLLWSFRPRVRLVLLLLLLRRLSLLRLSRIWRKGVFLELWRRQKVVRMSCWRRIGGRRHMSLSISKAGSSTIPWPLPGHRAVKNRRYLRQMISVVVGRLLLFRWLQRVRIRQRCGIYDLNVLHGSFGRRSHSAKLNRAAAVGHRSIFEHFFNATQGTSRAGGGGGCEKRFSLIIRTEALRGSSSAAGRRSRSLLLASSAYRRDRRRRTWGFSPTGSTAAAPSHHGPSVSVRHKFGLLQITLGRSARSGRPRAAAGGARSRIHFTHVHLLLGTPCSSRQSYVMAPSVLPNVVLFLDAPDGGGRPRMDVDVTSCTNTNVENEADNYGLIYTRPLLQGEEAWRRPWRRKEWI